MTLNHSKDQTNSLWVCLYCLSELDQDEQGFYCIACCKLYSITIQGQPDFRPIGPCSITLDWSYDPVWARFSWDLVQLGWPTNPLPFAQPREWEATELNIIRLIPLSQQAAWSLDIGCGFDRQRFREPLQNFGYQQIGIDIGGTAPDALADAHLLPFRDSTFDLVVTSAVFEHLKNPHIAMTEVARVIKPGGLFVGSIAFCEPFHISYFHQSPLAVFELLQSAGFECRSIILDKVWHAFRAHLEMGYAGSRYPSFIRKLIANGFYWIPLLPSVVKSILMRDK